MKRIFHLLLLLPVCCYSQQQTIDSLQRLLATATTDSAKYLLTMDIASNYEYSYHDSSLYYTNKALFLAQKNGKKLNEAAALSKKGFLLYRLQRLTESFQALTTASQIAEDPRNENDFWNTLKPQVTDKDYRLGILAYIHNATGDFMENVGEIDLATLHLREAIKIYRDLGDSSHVATTNAILAVWYNKYNKPDSALVLAETAEKILLQKNEELFLGFVYAVMGQSYLAKHDSNLGLPYLFHAMSVSKKYNTLDLLIYTYRSLTNFYIQEKKQDSALYYAQQAAKMHITLDPMDLGNDFDNLARSYQLNHKQDSAYKYQGIALATYDSLYKNRIKGIIGFQQLSFDQQQQLQQLEADKVAAQNRTRMYTLLAGLGVIMIFGFFLYRNNQQQKKANLQLKHQKMETEEQKLKAESALENLQSTQSQLIQSEKMASLGELTAGIAHEIQNPLNFVNNFSEINKEMIDELQTELQSGNVDEAIAISNDIKDNEAKINHHGKRADSIVKGMLQHSRQTKGVKEPTDINALADEYLRLSYHGLRAKDKSFNADFTTDFDPSIGKINIVPQDIGRVLLNLFNNAFQAISERRKAEDVAYNPTVIVTTKKVSSNSFDAKSSPSGAEGLLITVADNGNGIPQNIIDKIFQPFFTTKPTGQGTGLGLSLSYDIIKAHGGKIKVESKEGEGSKFIIKLPA